ncbi:MAG: M24 family metallopeptidase [Kiritimatiellia bacterium]
MNPAEKSEALLLIGGGADALNVRYICGFTAPDPFLYLQAAGKMHLLVSILELGRAGALGPSVCCHTVDTLRLNRKAQRTLGGQALGLLRHLGLKRVGVSGNCPVAVVRELEKGGIRVDVRSAPLFPQRLRKSEKELKALRASQRAAVQAMQTAFTLIRESRVDAQGVLRQPGGGVLSAEKLRHHLQRMLLDADCEAEELIVACGDQAVDPHGRGEGPLKAGELIVLDIFPRSRATGYWGDITRTVIKGTPTREQARLYSTVLKAQKAALSEVKAGESAKEIHDRICGRFAEAGYETGIRDGVPQGFIHSTGHGVGLEIHEAPSVSVRGGILESGQVITIEPGLYYRGIGGVRIEDTVEVTETGCRLLAPCTKAWKL